MFDTRDCLFSNIYDLLGLQFGCVNFFVMYLWLFSFFFLDWWVLLVSLFSTTTINIWLLLEIQMLSY